MSATIEYGLNLQPGFCDGEVDCGTMTFEGARISGWAHLLPEGNGPIQVIVIVGGEVVCRMNTEPTEASFRFTYDLPAAMFRPPLYVEFAVFAMDASGRGCKFPSVGTAFDLNSIRIGSRPDFLRAIQSPSDRMKSPEMLFYTSFHGLLRFSDDFAARSAAICTMGYRMNEGLIVPDGAREAFLREIDLLLASVPDVPRGLWLRWHTSVRLVAGYAAYRDNDFERATTHFLKVGDFAFELGYWPSALTNVLIGIFLSGWTLYQRQEWSAAASAWRRAEGVLRLGAAGAQFPNFYAYGELSNAVRVAQECFVGCLQAEKGGRTVSNTGLLSAGYELDIRHLSGVAYNLGLK